MCRMCVGVKAWANASAGDVSRVGRSQQTSPSNRKARAASWNSTRTTVLAEYESKLWIGFLEYPLCDGKSLRRTSGVE